MSVSKLRFAAALGCSLTSAALLTGGPARAEILDLFSSIGSKVGTPPPAMRPKPVPLYNPGVSAPAPVVAPSPVDPAASYDPFAPAVASPPVSPPPRIAIPDSASSPPAGWTGGEVCDETGCRLAPIRVPPPPEPSGARPSSLYVSPSGHTFGPPPEGVSIDVAPARTTRDLSGLRHDVLKLRKPGS